MTIRIEIEDLSGGARIITIGEMDVLYRAVYAFEVLVGSSQIVVDTGRQVAKAQVEAEIEAEGYGRPVDPLVGHTHPIPEVHEAAERVRSPDKPGDKLLKRHRRTKAEMEAARAAESSTETRPHEETTAPGEGPALTKLRAEVAKQLVEEPMIGGLAVSGDVVTTKLRAAQQVAQNPIIGGDYGPKPMGGYEPGPGDFTASSVEVTGEDCRAACAKKVADEQHKAQPRSDIVILIRKLITNYVAAPKGAQDIAEEHRAKFLKELEAL